MHSSQVQWHIGCVDFVMDPTFHSTFLGCIQVRTRTRTGKDECIRTATRFDLRRRCCLRAPSSCWEGRDDGQRSVDRDGR